MALHRLIVAVVIIAGTLAGMPAMSKPTSLPLRGVVVCVDPGHPSETSAGTETPDHKLTEQHVAWETAVRLTRLLQADGATVVLTKHHEHEWVANKHRAEIANAAHAALFLRLHCDSAEDPGFATFYPDRQGTIHGVHGPSALVLSESHRLADIFHAAAIARLHGHLDDRRVRGERRTAVGARQGALTGSIYAKEAALTIEMCVLNQPSDIRFIRSPGAYDTLTAALCAGVEACFHAR